MAPLALAAATVLAGCENPNSKAAATIEQLPEVRLLKAHYPDDHRQLMDRLRGLPAGASPEELRRAVEETVSGVVARQRPKASPETALELHRAVRMVAGALRRLDPIQCVAFMDGAEAPGLAKAMTPEMQARDLAAASDLLVQTSTRPQPPERAMSDAELAELTASFFLQLPDRDQDTAIRLLKSGRAPETADEARVMCDFDLRLSDAILARPNAGVLVRRYWAAME